MDKHKPHSTPAERKAYETLVVDHQHQIYVFIRSMIFNRSDADDILQDVNIILIKKRDSFTQGTNFKAWAFTIARFECLSYLRSYRNSKLTTVDMAALESLADIAEEVSGEMDDWLYDLRICIQNLSGKYRQMIRSRYYDRIPLEVSAEQQKITVPAYKQLLYRVRKGLKECIVKRHTQQNNPNDGK
jgi:RNA polymerase sigma-70 factor (ECF subfamily)